MSATRPARRRRRSRRLSSATVLEPTLTTMVFTGGIVAKGAAAHACRHANSNSDSPDDHRVAGHGARAPEGLVEAGALDHLLQVRDRVRVVEVRLREQALHLEAAHDEVVVHDLHGEGVEPAVGRPKDGRRLGGLSGGLGFGLGRAGLLHHPGQLPDEVLEAVAGLRRDDELR